MAFHQSELANGNAQSVDSILNMNRADKLLAIEQCLDPKLLEQLSIRLKKGEFLQKVVENEFTPIDIRFKLSFVLTLEGGMPKNGFYLRKFDFSRVSSKVQTGMAERIFSRLKDEISSGTVKAEINDTFLLMLKLLKLNPKRPKVFLLRLKRLLTSLKSRTSQKIIVKSFVFQKSKTITVRRYISDLKKYF